MTVNTLQVNMTKGELSPYLHARVDTEFYQGGMAEMRNACVLRYGGAARAPGSIFLGEAKEDDKLARFIRFEFNRDQVYAIEAGDLYFRFWTLDGRVESPPGTPVEVVTPYLEADLKYLQVRQSGDVIYIWCRKAAGGAHQPRTLTRTSETSWALALYEVLGGPFITGDVKGTTLDPAGTANLSAESGTADGTVAQDAGHITDYAFDRNKGTAYGTNNTSGFIEYDFSGADKVCDGYWVTAHSNASLAPSAWTFEGDGVVLDSQEGQSGWTGGETRFFEFENVTAYGTYTLRWLGQNDSVTAFTQIAEIGMHKSYATQSATNLTASSILGINNDTGFQTTDVGRLIELIPADGRIRIARIIARNSTTQVTVKYYGHALPDASPISRWRLGAFGDGPGWPSAGAIFEDRLTHARTLQDPLGVWLSVNGDYDNFRRSQPLVDDDGIALRLTGGKLNDIGWLNENRDLVAGTSGSLRAIGRNDQGRALSPSNARQRTETITPSSTAEPVSIENVVIFLDFFEQRLYEAAFTYEVEGYLARELSTLNEHLFAAGVEAIAYLSHPHKIIVGRRSDGKLIFFTYDREQKVVGGTLVDLGGVVESIADLPGVAGTDLWMIVRREVDGDTHRYVERLAEFWRTATTVQDVPVYAASALIYDDVATDTVTGADHLEGETVGIWADGRDIGDAVVAAGEVELPGGIEAEQIVIGIRMPFRLQALRLAQIGNQDGSGLGRQVKILEGMIDFFETAGVTAGSLSQTDTVRFENEAEEDPDAPVELRTGMYSLPVDDSWDNNGVFVIESDRMYPITVRGVSLKIEGEP